jgi:branched-subunit amino acid transport protein
MNDSLVLLAVLLWAVTYPSRAVPLLAARAERLPPAVLAYLRLVAPAVLAALAAVNALVVAKAGGSRELHLGATGVGVLLCVGVVAWRRNLFLGLATAMTFVALSRAAGFS